MRSPLLRLIVRAAGVVAAVTLTGRLLAQPPPPATLLPAVAPTISDTLIAGLPPEGKPVVLTWERAYALAVIRARSGKPFPGATFDPKVLDEQAARVGLADFARFRTEFLAVGPSFHDPSRDVYDLLTRLAEVENAQWALANREKWKRLLMELVQGARSGLTRFELDQVDDSLQQVKILASTSLTRLRDGLDVVKAELGLAPAVPLVPDRNALAGFRDVFEAAESWSLNPHRRLEELSRMAQSLPTLRDVVIGGRPLLETIDRTPDRLDEFLAALPGSSLQGGIDDPAVARVIPLRSRVRRLVDLHQAYEMEKRRFVLTMRLRDQTLEQLLGPRRSDPRSTRPTVASMIQTETDVMDVRNRLVSLWASAQAERMGLYAGLGELPFNDWKSFTEQLAAMPSPVPAAAAPVPAVAVPSPVPAPPALPPPPGAP